MPDGNAGAHRPVESPNVSFFSWLTGASSTHAAAEKREVHTPAVSQAAAPEPQTDSFGSQIQSQLHSDLAAFIEGSVDGDAALFGESLLAALENETLEPPSPPKEVLRIQRLLAQPDCDVAPLAAAITRDPSIAGRFVGIANSTLYGGTTAVCTVDDAVVRIGLKQTAMIVMAIVSKTKLFRVPGHEARARDLHRHCLAAAVVGQRLARRARTTESLAFMGGLLHDIGQIWMLSICADIHRESRGSQDIGDATVTALGNRFHAPFSALVAEAWGYNDAFVGAVLGHHHHSATAARNDPGLPDRLTLILDASNLLSHALLDDRPNPSPALADVLTALGIEDSPELRTECFDAFTEFEQQLA